MSGEPSTHRPDDPGLTRITYDREADALYVYLMSIDEGQARHTEEVEPGVVMVDRDDEGRVLGIEILLATNSRVEVVEK